MHYKQLLIPLAAVAYGATPDTPTQNAANGGGILAFLNQPFWSTVFGFAAGSLIAARVNKSLSSNDCAKSSPKVDLADAIAKMIAAAPDSPEHTAVIDGPDGKYTITLAVHK